MMSHVKGIGRLKYGPGRKAYLEVDKELSKYYLSLIPKSHYAQPQAYSTHITVVRIGIEEPDMEYWGYRDGEIITFRYWPTIKYNELYYWLRAKSSGVAEVRQKLGLPKYREGYKNYHITIGNRKQQNNEEKS